MYSVITSVILKHISKKRTDQNETHREEQPSFYSLNVCDVPSPDPRPPCHSFSPHFPPHLLSFYCFFYQLMLCCPLIVRPFSTCPSIIAHPSLEITHCPLSQFFHYSLTSISVLSLFNPAYIVFSLALSIISHEQALKTN